MNTAHCPTMDSYNQCGDLPVARAWSDEDRREFNRMLCENMGYFVRVARCLARRQDLMDELIQATVARALGSPYYSGNEKMVNWVRMLMRWEWGRIRKGTRETPISEIAEKSGGQLSFLIDPRRDSDPVDCIGERNPRLSRQINEMPVKLREILLLSAVDDFSHKELAERLNISVVAAKSRLHQAQLHLRRRIRDTNLIRGLDLPGRERKSMRKVLRAMAA